MNEKKIATYMSAFYNNQQLVWDKIANGYKKRTKEQCIKDIENTINELSEILKEIKE